MTYTQAIAKQREIEARLTVDGILDWGKVDQATKEEYWKLLEIQPERAIGAVGSRWRFDRETR